MFKLNLEEMVQFAFRMRDIAQKIRKEISQRGNQQIREKLPITICKDRYCKDKDRKYYCNILLPEKDYRIFLSINMHGQIGIHKAKKGDFFRYPIYLYKKLKKKLYNIQVKIKHHGIH